MLERGDPGDDVSIVVDTLLGLLDAAVIEAREPRLLVRGDALFWRTGGAAYKCKMIKLTVDDEHIAMTVSIP